jgi:hypothetical protein
MLEVPTTSPCGGFAKKGGTTASRGLRPWSERFDIGEQPQFALDVRAAQGEDHLGVLPPTIKGGRLRCDGEERTTWEPRRCTATAPVVTPAIWGSRSAIRSAGRGQRARDIGPTSTLLPETRLTWTMEPCDESDRSDSYGCVRRSSRLIMCWLCNRICQRDVETLSAPADAGEAKTFKGEWQIGIEGWICPKCVLRRGSASQN